MGNEIRKISKRASDLTAELDGKVQVAYAEEYVDALGAIADCITELETELAALKAEVAKYEWQEGHPDSDRMVLVCYGFDDGVKKYETDYFEKGGWYYGWGYNVLAWSEIRPWKGE